MLLIFIAGHAPIPVLRVIVSTHSSTADQIISWISGLGSLMAGVGALAVLLWQLTRAHTGDQKKRAQEERDQASHITWWLEVIPKGEEVPAVRDFADSGGEWFGADYPRLPHAAILIRNGSEDCVYEGSLQLPSWFDPGPEWDTALKPIIWRQLGVLPPGTVRYHIPTSYMHTPTQSARRKSDLAFNRHVEWVEFRDRKDVIWRRFWDGRLERQPDRPPNTETAHAP
jgi:hypothetical protein